MCTDAEVWVLQRSWQGAPSRARQDRVHNLLAHFKLKAVADRKRLLSAGPTGSLLIREKKRILDHDSAPRSPLDTISGQNDSYKSPASFPSLQTIEKAKCLEKVYALDNIENI